MPETQSNVYGVAKCLSALAITYMVLNPDKLGWKPDELLNIFAGFSIFYWAMIILRGQKIIKDIYNTGLNGPILAFIHYELGFLCIVQMLTVGSLVIVPVSFLRFPILVFCVGLPILCWQSLEPGWKQ